MAADRQKGGLKNKPDRDGEDALIAAISAVKATGTTIILIAHRPGIMEKVDKVLVLNQGRQELFGARDTVFNELAARAKRVAQLPNTNHAAAVKS